MTHSLSSLWCILLLGTLLGCGSAMGDGAGSSGMDPDGNAGLWGDAIDDVGEEQKPVLAVEILSPIPGWVLKSGESVQFDGRITGTPLLPGDLTVRWVSDRAGILWEGAPGPKGLVTHLWLSPDSGDHGVTLQVLSSAGDVVTETVEFFVNQPPDTPQVVLLPENPTTADPLRAVLVSPCRDPDGRSEVEYEWSWWHEGEALPGEHGPILSMEHTQRGEIWSVRVIPSDDYHAGNAGEAETVIVNAVPSYATAQIIPGTGGTLTPFFCEGVGWHDDDGDSPGATVSWRINGVEHPPEADGSLGTGLFSRDDTLQCVLVPEDGLSSGTPVLSADVQVANTPPTVGALAISPTEAHGATSLDCVVSEIVDADGDPTSTVVTWLLNGVELPSGGEDSLLPMELGGKHGDVITCRAQAEDADSIGPFIESEPVVLGNAPPMIALVEVTGADASGVATEMDVLGCQAWSAEDPDGDDLSVQRLWRVNDVLVLGEDGQPFDSETITGARFDKGDAVRCRVVSMDADGASTVLESQDVVVIVNTPPTITEAALSPSPTTRNTPMECAVVGWEDPDPMDALDAFDNEDPDDTAPPKIAVSWYVDDVIVMGENTATWTPSWVLPGSQVHCVLAPFDGEALGPVTISESVAVVNTAPSIGAVQIGPDPAYANSLITCTPLGWSDPEGDAPGFLFEWSVNGVNVISLGEDVLVGVEVSKGDVVQCGATPWDGVTAGTTILSSTLVLENHPPSLSGVTLTPAEGTPNSFFTCLPKEVVDADLEDEVSFFYHWYMEGGQWMPEWTSDTLPANSFSPGQSFYCTVQPYDGEDFGQVYVSNAATVLNTPPTLDDVLLLPANPTTATPLACTPVGFDDPDGDIPVYTVDWFVNSSKVTGEKGLVLPAGVAKQSQSVFCHLTYGDAYSVAGSIVSGTVVLGNAAPTAPQVSVLPPLAFAGDSLACVLDGGAVDPDGGDVSWVASWMHDGALVHEGEVLPQGMTAGCGEWTCVVTAMDGQGAESPPGEASATVSPAKGLALDGNGAAVVSSPAMVSGLVDWTLEAWFLGGEGVILEHRNGQASAAGAGYTLGLQEDGRPHCTFHGMNEEVSGMVEADTSLNDGEFHHVAATWSGSTGELWVDGQLVDAQSFEWAPELTGDLVLGNSFVSAEGVGFTGTLDGIHVSEGVLYDDAFYPGSPVAPQLGTVVLYDFEEPGGFVIHDLAGNHDAILTLTGASLGPGWCLAPNQYPSDPVVSLGPEMPLPGEPLICQGDSIDPDGDPLSFTYAWKREGVLMGDYTGNVLPLNATDSCEMWTCEVTVSDGKVDSGAGTASVEIQPDWNAGVMQGFSVGASQLSFSSYDVGDASAYVPALSPAYYPLVIENIVVNAHPIGGAVLRVWSVDKDDVEGVGTEVFMEAIPPGNAGIQVIASSIVFENPDELPRIGIEATINNGLSVKMRDAGTGVHLQRNCGVGQPGQGCVDQGAWGPADVATDMSGTHWEIHAEFKTALGGFCQ